jgi:putative NADH-flavin reductase
METDGVRRLLWESSWASARRRANWGPVYNWLLFPLFLRHVFADKERQEQILRSSSLDWTIVQSAALTNGPRTGAYRIGCKACAGRLIPRISRADVAHFMLEELTRKAHVKQTVAVAICYS